MGHPEEPTPGVFLAYAAPPIPTAAPTGPVASLAASSPSLDHVVEVLGTGISRCETVLLICPSWSSRALVRNVAVARAVVGAERVVVCRPSAAPLAVRALATVCGTLAAAGVPAAMLAQASDVLTGVMRSGAWLSSVGGLTSPAPTLVQHLRSWLPGSAFFATALPTPGVGPLHPDPLTAPPIASRVVVSRHGVETGWVQRNVVPALGSGEATEVPEGPDDGRFWGKTRFIEVATYPCDVPGLVAALGVTLPWDRCSWCTQTVDATLAACPTCGMGRRAIATAATGGLVA